MRHLKISAIMSASLVLTVLMFLAGCGEDHRDHYRDNRDRDVEYYDRHDNDRSEERHDSDRHEDHGGDSGHEGEHGEHGER